MATLIYASNVSLDGFTEDATGAFDWGVHDEAIHDFYTDMLRGVGTQLLGRRMYETMAVWETEPAFAEESRAGADFAAAWQDSDKWVYSTTLTEAITARTRVLPAFDVEEVRSLKTSEATDILVSGPGLAGLAMSAGLVDQVRMIISPITVGGGKPAFPLDQRFDLELIDERRFESGGVYVAYSVR